jgi:hypothetical protein
VGVPAPSQAGVALISGAKPHEDRTSPGRIKELLDRLGRPSPILVRGRGFERPYISPPTVRVIRQGAPLDVSTLDSSRTYLWLVDAQGDIRIAPEQDPSYASLYPKRVYPEGRGRSDHGLKHADLAAGSRHRPVPALLRPPARMGGELTAEIGPGGRLTGRWIMDDNSAYNARKTRLDRRCMGENELYIAFELLVATGTDTSGIVVHTVKPG